MSYLIIFCILLPILHMRGNTCFAGLVLSGKDHVEEFQDYKLIEPKIYDVREKKQIAETKQDETNHCLYNGTMEGNFDSWVAISTCNGLKHRIADIKNEQIHLPYNANNESRYIELILVVDHGIFRKMDESKENVIKFCKDISNIVNSRYAPLNIFIALVGVVIWTEHDEIELSENGDATLERFLKYRRNHLNPTHPNDNAQLLTIKHFKDGVVSKSLKGPICTYEYSGGVNTYYTSNTGSVALSVAHSLGHNLGMEHDQEDCKCPDNKCIMSTSITSGVPTQWSTCSVEYVKSAFGRGMDHCLKNKPEFLFDGPLCGNGYVEPGEDCDCGLQSMCNNSCCDFNTCKFKSNATCANGECCDINNCHLKTAGVLCRSANQECDLPEYCTGQSEYCPKNVYKMNMEPCFEGKSVCYNGACNTRDAQCKLLWGNETESSDESCDDLNTKGNRHGNCGYNKLNSTYYKCTEENIHCGILNCDTTGEKLEFGMEAVSIITHKFKYVGGIIMKCQTVIVDLGLQQVDPGLTPDGVKCGQDKICVDQKCRSLEELRRELNSCPNNCSGNGWCNSEGYCHCKVGFASPDCSQAYRTSSPAS
ncbi:unnamed protein product [Ceutorhynchus assimilis]|uniref:Uncharacterized protein n=1 Tax=Ceutorhynchus assimilis TaxID=467358 RepID=A0A9N9MDD0_9CUCU|nr:unnamed protein product [Ceutorhynchus assimilis]